MTVSSIRRAVVAMITATALLAAASSALADGQQIRIFRPVPRGARYDLNMCFADANYAFINGKNQNGHDAVWKGRLSLSGAITKGWWWKGNVTINVWGPRGHISTIHAWVPSGNDSRFVLWPHTVAVSCMGTLEYANVAVETGSIFTVGCIALPDNPTGEATQTTHYVGYYGIGWNEQTVGWGIARGPGGGAVSVPFLLTNYYNTYDCN